MKHPTLVTVRWLDASENGNEEGTPGTFKGRKPEDQLLETPGWWLGVVDDQVLLGRDLGIADPDLATRSVYRIPRILVEEVRVHKKGQSLKGSKLRGLLGFSTEKDASPTRKTRVRRSRSR